MVYRLNLLLLLVGFAVSCVVAAPLDKSVISCKVCERAVHHVWSRGAALRRACLTTKGVDRDDRCDFHQVHPWAVDQMVWGVCDALPTTYQALEGSEFDLILHDDPQHSTELADLIKTTCIDFLHTYHGVERIGQLVLDHLHAGRDVENVLDELHRELCGHACAGEENRRRETKKIRQRKTWEPVHSPHDEF